MSVDACITSRSGEVFALTERNVLPVRVLVALGETEVDDEDIVLVGVVSADQEVVWLDVSMNNPFLMNLLDALDLSKITRLC